MKRNRYEKLRQHKKKMKIRHSLGGFSYESVSETEQRERENDYGRECIRNGGYHYWQCIYYSGRRVFAKKCTNAKLRSKYRELISNKDFEEIRALKGADYQKEYDYSWEVW